MPLQQLPHGRVKMLLRDSRYFRLFPQLSLWLNLRLLEFFDQRLKFL